MMTPRIAVKSLVPLLLVVFGFSFFVNLLSMVVPLYTMQVFDRVMTSRSLDTLWAITAIAVFMLCAYAILDAVRSKVMIGIDRWLETNLFPEITRVRLERAAEGRRDTQREGLTDLRNLRQFFTGQSVLAVLDTVWSPLFILVAFLIHPLLGTIGAIGAIGLMLLSLTNEYSMREPQKLANLLTAKTNHDTLSIARNGEVVAAMGMGATMLKRVEASAESARKESERANARATTISGLAKLFRYLVQIAILAVGMWLVLGENLTAGAVFAAMMITSRGLAPFEQMQRTWSTVVSARQSYQQLQDYLTEPGPFRSTINYPAPKGALQVEGLTYVPRGGQKPLIQGLNFALKPGEALGIIGPSAAGKSTLARLLVGVWQPSAGKVRLDGIDVAAWNRGDFGPHVGYIPQDVALIAGTVRENIGRFTDATDEDIIAAAEAANAHNMIVRLAQGYDTDVGDSGAFLSGGQRQRIALARALFGNPRFLVLDEPNSNLDAEGEAAMLQALQAAKAAGATILIIAHRPSLLGFVDKLLVLKDGRVDQFGDRHAVLAKLQPRPMIVSSGSETDAALGGKR